MKTIMSNKSRTTTIEAPMSPARERLQAQLKIQRGMAAVMEDQFKAGECTEAELQYQQNRVAAREQELTSLDTTESFDRQLQERRRAELPVLENELKDKARRAARLFLEAREELIGVRAVHEQIMQLADPKFPGFAVIPGVTNRDLVSACGSGSQTSFVRLMLDKDEACDHWLAQLKAAGIEV